MYPMILDGGRSREFAAPWDWFELEIEDRNPRPDRAMAGEMLAVKQHCGRRLELARFYQYPTHGGLLIGIAQARNSTVEEAVRSARELFGEGEHGVALLRPRLTRLPASSCYCRDLPPGRLPLVTTIAVFNSEPDGACEAFRSSAVVVWFQEGFGLSCDGHVIRQLEDLDWPAYSRDWDA